MSVNAFFDWSANVPGPQPMPVFYIRRQLHLSLCLTVVFALGFYGLLILKSDRAFTADQPRPVLSSSYSTSNHNGNSDLPEFSKSAFERPNRESI